MRIGQYILFQINTNGYQYEISGNKERIIINDSCENAIRKLKELSKQ